ncbi:MAG TPA: hypothetical protein VFI02_20330 [Armatimonadota bacterium]|nr:hypothetical protein [Armatimonadota bacterium]
MKHLSRILLLVLILLLALPLWAQRVELLIDEGAAVRNPPESLELQYKFEDKEIRRYDVTITGSGVIKLPSQSDYAKVESRTTLTYVQHAKSQDLTTGVWKMEWDVINGQMIIPEFGSMEITVPPIDLEMDKYGHVSNIKGLDDLGVTPGLTQGKLLADITNQLKSTGFPSHPIKVGDKWEDKFTVELPDQKPIPVASTSDFMEFERVNNFDCAKIHTTYEIPFTLKMKPETEPKPAQGAGDLAKPTSASPVEDKPSVISGTEKGEFWTHFAYKEGKIIQSFGTIELVADITKGEPSKDVKPAAEKEPAPDPALGEPPPKPPSHDLEVKYQTVSKFNAQKPRFYGEENQ